MLRSFCYLHSCFALVLLSAVASIFWLQPAAAASASQFFSKVVGKTVLFKRSNAIRFDFIAYFPNRSSMYVWGYTQVDHRRRIVSISKLKSGKRGFCYRYDLGKSVITLPECVVLDDVYRSIAETRRGDIFSLRRPGRPFSLGTSISSLSVMSEKVKKLKSR